MEPKVRFTRDGAVGTLTLASPPLNLIGQQLISDLLAAVDQVEAAEGLRALLLRGEGTVFSAGADVALFGGMSADQLRPLIGFQLLRFDSDAQYARTSFYASAAILILALVCITMVSPGAATAPTPDAIPET